MGKRKSRKPAPPPKKAPKLETAFDCPFCSHRASVECRVDLKYLIAEAACRVCKESFYTAAQALTEPVDVYADWIDACESVNEGVVEDDRRRRRRRTSYDDDL